MDPTWEFAIPPSLNVGVDVSHHLPRTSGALHGPRLNVVGYVEDPLPWLQRCRVHLAPLRFGSGVKLKFLDTMAAGLPLVTSAVGAEGLHLGPLARHLVAEEPSELAHLTRAVYRDRTLWERVQRELLAIVRSHFSHEAYRAAMVDAFSGLGVAPPRPATDAPGR